MGDLMQRLIPVAPGPVPDRMPARPARGVDGWGIYLAAVVLFLPLVVPIGTYQLAVLDGFNVLAIAAFAIAVLSRRIEPRAPFLLAVFAIAIGSLIAVVNAVSVPAAVLALVQDVYLYLWFVMLVSVLRARGDLVGLRMAWVGIACVVAVVAIVGVVLKGNTTIAGIVGPKGARATGTFSDPNMCADYLGMSLFVVLSLSGHMGRALRWGVVALLVAAIVATKSNGGALSLFVGLVVWAVIRARTRRIPLPVLAGAALVALSLVLSAAWMSAGFGVGSGQLKGLESGSFLGRFAHSSEGRLKIWRQLEQTLQKSPLGIGPGNSRWVPLTVEGRERPHSMYSKEAHNDYLAYAIERGPLALLALLFLLWQAFAKVRTVWKRRARSGEAAGVLAAALAGALACSAMHSLTIERLHFRHYWLLLAMVCAFAEAARPHKAAQSAAAPEPETTAPPLAAAQA
jgi:O-antigen ligase